MNTNGHKSAAPAARLPKIDVLKGGQVTSLFTSLTHGGHVLQHSKSKN
jgi:hypothetical protein